METFPERSVRLLKEAFESCRVTSILINAVLKYDKVDVTAFEQFLNSPNPEIKMGAIDVISQKGNVGTLIDLIAVEKEKELVVYVFDRIFERIKRSGIPDVGFENIEKLEHFLHSDSSLLMESTIQFFRRVNKAQFLLGLMFNENDNFVKRIKKYIGENSDG